MLLSELAKKIEEALKECGDREVYFKEVLLHEWSEIWGFETWELENEKFFVITGGY
jgi:hypothetical protein